MHRGCNKHQLIGGRYRIRGILGKGGFGSVYKVLDEHIGREYAMKVCGIPDEKSADREIFMLRTLHHKGLPALHDVIKEENKLYIVMELFQGITLEQYVSRNGKLNEQQAIYIAKKLCDILCYLHGKSIPVVHGDIKPQNIMIQNNTISLIDFGCAFHVYSAGEIRCGTPGYAAVETYHGELGTYSDVYSVGMVMFYMITGYIPLDGKMSDKRKELKRCGAGKKYQNIVERATKEQIHMRYWDAVSLKDALSAIKKGERIFPGLTTAYLAGGLRIAGAGMLLAGLIIYKGLEAVWCNFMTDKMLNEIFIYGIFLLAAGIVWGYYAANKYKTAVLEWEYNLFLTDGNDNI